MKSTTEVCEIILFHCREYINDINNNKSNNNNNNIFLPVRSPINNIVMKVTNVLDIALPLRHCCSVVGYILPLKIYTIYNLQA